MKKEKSKTPRGPSRSPSAPPSKPKAKAAADQTTLDTTATPRTTQLQVAVAVAVAGLALCVCLQLSAGPPTTVNELAYRAGLDAAELAEYTDEHFGILWSTDLGLAKMPGIRLLKDAEAMRLRRRQGLGLPADADAAQCIAAENVLRIAAEILRIAEVRAATPGGRGRNHGRRKSERTF